MGKWLNWAIWGTLHGIINGMLLFLLVGFILSLFGSGVSSMLLYVSQLTGVPVSTITGAGVAAALLVFILAIGYNVLTWLVVGVVSLVTSPVLRKLPMLRHEVVLVFVPWLLLTIITSLLFGSAGLAPFIIGAFISLVSIWIWVWLYKAVKLQKYLPY